MSGFSRAVCPPHLRVRPTMPQWTQQRSFISVIELLICIHWFSDSARRRGFAGGRLFPPPDRLLILTRPRAFSCCALRFDELPSAVCKF